MFYVNDHKIKENTYTTLGPKENTEDIKGI